MSTVISVGNISMGGTGKTPFTLMLSKYFLKAGRKVCILSRGYKGKIGLDTNIICDGKNILLKPPLAADEPFMLANHLKNAIIITGKDRTKSYKFAKMKFSPDIFILDDGFQHRKMHRDIDILLLDYKKPISTGFPFPFGYLREFPSAIRRADIVVFTRAEDEKIPDEVEKYILNKPYFFSQIFTTGLFNNENVCVTEKVKNSKFIAFSGIAKNNSFLNTLRQQGLNIVKTTFFNDHHSYTERDEEKLLKLIQKNEADFFVTTEKDFVKLTENIRMKALYLRMEVKLNNEKVFFNEIQRRTKRLTQIQF